MGISICILIYFGNYLLLVPILYGSITVMKTALPEEGFQSLEMEQQFKKVYSVLLLVFITCQYELVASGAKGRFVQLNSNPQCTLHIVKTVQD